MNPATAPHPPQMMLSRRQLAALLSLSLPTLDRLRAAGKLPRPVKLTRGLVRWKSADVENWLNAGCPSLAEFEARHGTHPRSCADPTKNR